MILSHKMLWLFPALLLTIMVIPANAEKVEIPTVHDGISYDDSGSMIFETSGGEIIPLEPVGDNYTLAQMRSCPQGNDNGIEFDFGNEQLDGRLYYGFIPSTEEVKHPYPVFFKRSAEISKGSAVIDIRNRMVGKYDIVGWQQTGIIRLGYRIVTDKGLILYDGKLIIKGTGPFEVDTSVVEGPFVNLLTDNSAVISFVTNFPTIASVIVGDQTFSDKDASCRHEILIDGLQPDRQYHYTVIYGNYRDSYSFRTAPLPGSRLPFTFAYASDGRGNNGGGERNIRGVNAYIMKRIAILCSEKNAKFLQFTGDMIGGYTNDVGRINLEYANWKRAVEPFAHYIPFIAGCGNHEVLTHTFYEAKHWVAIDKFPFDSLSSEVVFARNFVNPANGPASEDGAVYDPDATRQDFPPYDETVFHYVYDNVAMISLNSNYWYSPSIEHQPEIGGNLHGYIMDNQLQWLQEILGLLEDDDDIDHIFVTLHTPIFPNGGHVGDDMWYNGSNEPRPTIAGNPVEKGIIERRDQLLDLLMNHSTKVCATLTGDEHNYSLLKVSEDLPIYPKGYDGPRLSKFRPFWHINNGAAGAPYYGKEQTPWSSHLQAFSTQNALVLFYVDGEHISVEVINPDTMELIDQFEL